MHEPNRLTVIYAIQSRDKSTPRLREFHVCATHWVPNHTHEPSPNKPWTLSNNPHSETTSHNNGNEQASDSSNETMLRAFCTRTVNIGIIAIWFITHRSDHRPRLSRQHRVTSREYLDNVLSIVVARSRRGATSQATTVAVDTPHSGTISETAFTFFPKFSQFRRN